MQQLFWIGFWLAGAAAPSGLHAELSPEKLYKKVLPSVMTLEVESRNGEKFVGSAVLALADDCVLTAWHVVADARSVWAVFADGQRVRVVGFLDHAPRSLLQAALCGSTGSGRPRRAHPLGAPPPLPGTKP